MNSTSENPRNMPAGHSRIARLLRLCAPASRAELAEKLGLTQAAVSMNIHDMIARGFVVETGRRQGRRGPPQIDLELNANAGFALGVHIDSYLVYLSLLDFSGVARCELEIKNRFNDYASAAKAIAEGAENLLEKIGQPKTALLGTGVALPTRFGYGGIPFNLSEEIKSWRGADVAELLSQEIGCPVMVENDVNAAALGEFTIGNENGYESFFYLYLSGGIGGALMINGELYRGHKSNAGEIGALRPRSMDRPSFDDLISFISENGETAPDNRDSDVWDEFLYSVPSLRSAWIERASDEAAQLIFVVTALLDPLAIFIGSTLPRLLLSDLVKMTESKHAQKWAEKQAKLPEIFISDVPTRSCVAHGAAALVLHSV